MIAKERTKFVDGCVAQGYGKEFGEQIFDTIEPFADYSFNKSHSVGYGYLAYQTAYLKANYPVEYLAALLTSVKSNKDQTAVFLNECRQMDIAVLVPDVNESVSDFSVRPGGTAGLGADPAPVPSADTAGGRTGDVVVPRKKAREIGAIRFGMSAVRNVGEGVVGLHRRRP